MRYGTLGMYSITTILWSCECCFLSLRVHIISGSLSFGWMVDLFVMKHIFRPKERKTAINIERRHLQCHLIAHKHLYFLLFLLVVLLFWPLLEHSAMNWICWPGIILVSKKNHFQAKDTHSVSETSQSQMQINGFKCSTQVIHLDNFKRGQFLPSFVIVFIPLFAYHISVRNSCLLSAKTN